MGTEHVYYIPHLCFYLWSVPLLKRYRRKEGRKVCVCVHVCVCVSHLLCSRVNGLVGAATDGVHKLSINEHLVRGMNLPVVGMDHGLWR